MALAFRKPLLRRAQATISSKRPVVLDREIERYFRSISRLRLRRDAVDLLARCWESQNEIGVYLSPKGEQSSEVVRYLLAHRSDIEKEIGLPVEWLADDESYLISAAREETDFESPEALARQHEWLQEYLKAFTRVLGPALRTLERDLAGDES